MVTDTRRTRMFSSQQGQASVQIFKLFLLDTLHY